MGRRRGGLQHQPREQADRGEDLASAKGVGEDKISDESDAILPGCAPRTNHAARRFETRATNDGRGAVLFPARTDHAIASGAMVARHSIKESIHPEAAKHGNAQILVNLS